MSKFLLSLVLGLLTTGIAGCGNGSASRNSTEKPSIQGMTVLPSGLQYRVLKAGAGLSPGPTDRVEVHYRGRLMDGTEFDSSYSSGKPLVFAVNRVIKGWTEALQLMKEGCSWQLCIPPELAYGAAGHPPVIPENATLFFDVELLKVHR